jgi:hypothetical protein
MVEEALKKNPNLTLADIEKIARDEWIKQSKETR